MKSGKNILTTTVGAALWAALVVITLVGLWFFLLKEPKFDYENSNVRDEAITAVLDRAIEANDPSICKELPLSATYWAGNYDWGKNVSKTDPRDACLQQYYSQTKNAEACYLIAEDGFRDRRNNCFRDHALLSGNESLCDQVDDEIDTVICKAKVSRDTALCDSLPQSRQVECLNQVVRITGEFEKCFVINSPEVGGGWWAWKRNNCIRNAIGPEAFDLCGYNIADPNPDVIPPSMEPSECRVLIEESLK